MASRYFYPVLMIVRSSTLCDGVIRKGVLMFVAVIIRCSLNSGSESTGSV